MPDPQSPQHAPSTAVPASRMELDVDGRRVAVEDSGGSLLDALREQLGLTGPKDGCAPQGQCGCCTVLVDGAPRVACVTPLRRVRGRTITTIEGLADAARWADAFTATGASQCGFCTPGIVLRLAALDAKDPDAGHADVERALLAHLCRCTGWRTILDAWDVRHGAASDLAGHDLARRDLDDAATRAHLEGGVDQRVHPDVALGRAPFADDTAPPGRVALLGDGPADDPDAWVVADTLAAARATVGPVQGRRTTADAEPPIPVPPGDWHLTLQTSWTEPAYLETDVSWAMPDGPPADPRANGGDFGGKAATPVAAVARVLATREGVPVRVRSRREDVVRWGATRPPLAAGLRADGSGVVHVARTPGIVEAIRAANPSLDVIEVDLPGPPTSVALRAAGWAEAVALTRVASGAVGPVEQAGGGTAEVTIDDGGPVRVRVRVQPGRVLDAIVLRSYCIGAAHHALSLVASEALTVDDDGDVQDLTIRSFGVLRATETPPIDVVIDEDPDLDARPVSDAVFAATLAAAWTHHGTPGRWPTGLGYRAET